MPNLSTLVTNTIPPSSISADKLSGGQSGSAPVYGCRAWVIFDGTRNVDNTGASTIGQPVFIRARGNVSSVVKNSVGNYTVNFITNMPSANYVAVATLDSFVSTMGIATRTGTPTDSSFNMSTVSNGTGFDTDNISVLVIA